MLLSTLTIKNVSIVTLLMLTVGCSTNKDLQELNSDPTYQLLKRSSRKSSVLDYGASSLFLEGTIDADAREKITSRTGIEYLYVNTAGGEVVEALQIANWISKNSVTVIIEGVCISSCANYIITAAKSVRGSGMIAFHGNILQMLNSCLNKTRTDCSPGADGYSVETVARKELEFYQRNSRAMKLAFTTGHIENRPNGETVFFNDEILSLCGIHIDGYKNNKALIAWLNVAQKKHGARFHFEDWSNQGTSICLEENDRLESLLKTLNL